MTTKNLWPSANCMLLMMQLLIKEKTCSSDADDIAQNEIQ